MGSRGCGALLVMYHCYVDATVGPEPLALLRGCVGGLPASFWDTAAQVVRFCHSQPGAAVCDVFIKTVCFFWNGLFPPIHNAALRA